MDLAPINFRQYSDTFKGSEDKKWKAVGDVDASCLYCYEDAIRNIKKYLNDPKIIILLRNPAERAYSHFMMRKMRNQESREFREALIEEDTDSFRPYKQGSCSEQVKAYLDNFSQVKIYLYDDLEADSVALMQDLFAFIGVASSFRPNTSMRYNVSGVPKVKIINSLRSNYPLKTVVQIFISVLGIKKWVKKIAKKLHAKNLKKTAINESDRHYLVDYYREDVQVLQKLIQRDLSHWLK